MLHQDPSKYFKLANIISPWKPNYRLKTKVLSQWASTYKRIYKYPISIWKVFNIISYQRNVILNHNEMPLPTQENNLINQLILKANIFRCWKGWSNLNYHTLLVEFKLVIEPGILAAFTSFNTYIPHNSVIAFLDVYPIQMLICAYKETCMRMFIIEQTWKPFQCFSVVEWMNRLLLPYIEICTAMTMFKTITMCNNMYKSHKHNIMFSRKNHR